jgi:hypothetical protein
MKNIRDIDREQEPICAVWKNSPGDPKNDHTRILSPIKTARGEIRVCTKCKQEMLDIIAFQKRKIVGVMQSQMLTTEVITQTKNEIMESIEIKAGIKHRSRVIKQSTETTPAFI